MRTPLEWYRDKRYERRINKWKKYKGMLEDAESTDWLINVAFRWPKIYKIRVRSRFGKSSAEIVTQTGKEFYDSHDIVRVNCLKAVLDDYLEWLAEEWGIEEVLNETD